MLNSIYGNIYSNQSISKDDFIKSFEASQSGKKFGPDNIFNGELSAEAIGYIFEGLDKNGDGIVDNLDFSNAIENQDNNSEMNEDDINYLLQEFEKMEKGNYTPEENFLYKQTTTEKEKITEEKNKQIKDINNNQKQQQDLQTNPIIQEQHNPFQQNIIEQERKQKNKLGLLGL